MYSLFSGKLKRLFFIFAFDNRFKTGSNVIVSAPTKFKSGRELQLPSMSQLTNKTSSQHFFLRILKVIIQLREAARSAFKKKLPRGGQQIVFVL